MTAWVKDSQYLLKHVTCIVFLISYSQENSGAKFENRPLTRACKPTQGNLKQLSELNRLKIIHFLQQDISNAEICEELFSITRTQCHQIINSDNNEVLLFVWCFRGVTNTYPEHARNSLTFYHTDAASCLVANRPSASKQSTFTVKTSDKEILYFSSGQPSKSFQEQHSSEE